MKYLYVMDSHNPDQSNHNMTKLITDQTGDFLYSLIGGLRQKDFGLHTLVDVAMKIRDYAQRYLLSPTGSLYADSGGYSILIGAVPLELIPRFIKCYNQYVSHEQDIYNYIFSLDIAYNKGYPEMNTKSTIYDLNKASLIDLRRLLDEHPQLADKIFFVWHFKMLSQYEIFKKIYDELELSRFVNNRSIGGMVGMRGGKKAIRYSPFTAIAFRCLLDFITAGRVDRPFRLHFLGMYIPYDRFQIAFLEKLFRRYLSGITEVLFSYDSINFEHTARLNKQQPIFDLFDKTDLVCYESAIHVPPSIIDTVYTDPTVNGFIQYELNRRGTGKRLLNADSFGPLSIYSNKRLDDFFQNIIDKYEMIDLVFRTKSPTALSGPLRSILDDLGRKYDEVFKPEMIKSVAENMGYTFMYHRWFLDRKDYESLDYFLRCFINMIGFPDLLR